MRCAILENNTVVNVIEISEEGEPVLSPGQTWKITIAGNIGDTFDAALDRFVAPAPPAPPVPVEISDRQFAHALALLKLIPQEEALAWVMRGEIPTALNAAVEAIESPDVKFTAQMLLGGATVFERQHPMVASLGAALGMSEEQIDGLWSLAASL